MTLEQSDIITIEGMKGCFLVISKNFFNVTKQVVLCPIVQDTFLDPLHTKIETDEVQGVVMCEQMRLIDLRCRGYNKADKIHYPDIIDVTDAIQSIFDY